MPIMIALGAHADRDPPAPQRDRRLIRTSRNTTRTTRDARKCQDGSITSAWASGDRLTAGNLKVLLGLICPRLTDSDSAQEQPGAIEARNATSGGINQQRVRIGRHEQEGKVVPGTHCAGSLRLTARTSDPSAALRSSSTYVAGPFSARSSNLRNKK